MVPHNEGREFMHCELYLHVAWLSHIQWNPFLCENVQPSDYPAPVFFQAGTISHGPWLLFLVSTFFKLCSYFRPFTRHFSCFLLKKRETPQRITLVKLNWQKFNIYHEKNFVVVMQFRSSLLWESSSLSSIASCRYSSWPRDIPCSFLFFRVNALLSTKREIKAFNKHFFSHKAWISRN